MQFRYLPDGAPETSAMLWDFAPNKMTNAEAEQIEELTGWSLGQWEEWIYKGSVKASHALLYVMLRRTRPNLRYKEVVFSLSEVSIVLSDEEEAQFIERAERAAEGLDPFGGEQPDPGPAAGPTEGGDDDDNGAAAGPFVDPVDQEPAGVVVGP